MKRAFYPILSALLVTGLCGCTAVKTIANADLHAPGGADSLAENRLMPAATPQMELYRATELFAIFSDIGARNLQTPADKEYFVKTMLKTNDDINQSWAMLNRPCKTSADNMTLGCAELTEHNLLPISSDLLVLAKFALPTDKLQRFLAAVKNGNVIGSVEAIVSAAGKLVLEFHRGAATSRASEAIVVPFSDDTVSTFVDADTYFMSHAGAVANTRVDAHAINALYHISYRACGDIADSLPKQSLDNLATAIVQQSRPNGGAEYVCNLHPAA